MNMRKQRLMGAGLLAISAAMAALAWMGSTPEERDITAAVRRPPGGGCWLQKKIFSATGGGRTARYRGRRSKRKKGAWITWQGNGLLKRRASKAGRM